MANVFRGLVPAVIRGTPTPMGLLSPPSARNLLLDRELTLPPGASVDTLPRVAAWSDRRTITAAVPLVIVTIPPAAAPFPGQLWPLPEQRRRAILPQSTRPTNAAPTARVPFPFASVQDLPPAPTRGHLQLRTWLQSLKSDLIPVGVDMPFDLTEWPLPLAKPAARSLLTWTQPLNVLLAGTDALPFSQNDWPLPRVPRDTLDRRSYIDGTTLPLISQDTIYGLGGQPPSYQTFPNPRGKPTPMELLSWTNDLVRTTLTPFVQPPLTPADWPLPATKPMAVALRTHLSYYVIDDSAPFRQTEWPVPIRVSDSRALRIFTTPLQVLLTGVDILPFRQTEWPIPLPKSVLHDLRTSTRAAAVYLIGQDALPFRQTEWPNPQGKPFPPTLRGWLQSLSLQTSGTDVLPFRQTEWPNPRVKGRPVVSKEEPDRFLLLLAGRDQLPFRQTQWPLPRVAPAPPLLLTLTQSPSLAIVVPVEPPELFALGHRDGHDTSAGTGHRPADIDDGGTRGGTITPGSGRRRW